MGMLTPEEYQDWQTLKALQTIAEIIEERHPREYPFGHPKYRPPKDAVLPYIPDSEYSGVTLEFDTEDEAKEFYYVFKSLSQDAKDRALAHMIELEDK